MPRLRTPYLWTEIVFELRSRSSTTQVELAAMLDCSVSTVSKWERGETTPIARQQRKMDDLGQQLGYPRGTWPRKGEQRRLFFSPDGT